MAKLLLDGVQVNGDVGNDTDKDRQYFYGRMMKNSQGAYVGAFWIYTPYDNVHHNEFYASNGLVEFVDPQTTRLSMFGMLDGVTPALAVLTLYADKPNTLASQRLTWEVRTLDNSVVHTQTEPVVIIDADNPNDKGDYIRVYRGV
jgi:hypothetical protein